MKAWEIIVLVTILALCVFLVVWSLRRNKKKGGGCCGGCSGCAGCCAPIKPKKEEKDSSSK